MGLIVIALSLELLNSLVTILMFNAAEPRSLSIRLRMRPVMLKSASPFCVWFASLSADVFCAAFPLKRNEGNQPGVRDVSRSQDHAMPCSYFSVGSPTSGRKTANNVEQTRYGRVSSLLIRVLLWGKGMHGRASDRHAISSSYLSCRCPCCRTACRDQLPPLNACF